MSTDEPRGYDGRLRAEQSRLTRRRVLAAAEGLFLARGYGGTTVDAIAGEAGVSLQTVYNAVGGKAAVLKAVYDVAMAGDDEPVPISERPAVRAMLAADDPRACLAHYAALCRQLSERAGPLLAVLLPQLAGGDAELRAWGETIEQERATGTGRTAAHVAERFGLRDGLTAAEAADVLWVLAAPDLVLRLVHRRGWSWDRYQRWLATAMADALVGPGAVAPTGD